MRKSNRLKFLTLSCATAALIALLGCSHETPPTSFTTEIEPQPVPLQISAIQKEHAFDVDGPGNPTTLFAFPNSVTPSLTDTSYDIYGLTFLWGQLVNIPNPLPVITDWSGTLTFNGEAVIMPLRPIDFETNEDSLFLTDNPAVSAWASRANGTDLDGLSFVLFVKRGISYIQPPTLSFATSPFSKNFSQEQLEQFAAFYPIPGKGGIAIFAQRLKISECPSGTLSGEWVKSDIPGATGTVQGAFYASSNEPKAMFSGAFTTNSSNTGPGGTVQGTISGYMTDEILGTFHGTWRYTDPRMCPICGSGKGEFIASYELNDGTKGRMIGGFGYPANDQQLNLPLLGVWRTSCASGEDIGAVK